MGEFLAGNDWKWRLLRTVAQGVLGVVVANLDLIMGWCVMDPSTRARPSRRQSGSSPPSGSTWTRRSRSWTGRSTRLG